MNKYENIMIIKEDLEDCRIDEIIKEYSELIRKNGGNVTDVEKIGLKNLAYEVQHYKRGYYLKNEIDSDIDAITELERYLRITDDVLKFITIKLED